MIARVYHAISAVAGELASKGIDKTRLNSKDNYLYRSIDDVMEAIAPLVARHRLCILPRVLERTATERIDDSNALIMHVALKVAFDMVSAEDGSVHTIEAYGEAIDTGDKGTAKAMQSAYKYAVLKAFCVPALRGEDADARSHTLKATPPPEPVEGWQQWCEAMIVRIEQAETSEAVAAMRELHRHELVALSRDKPVLYRKLGEAFAKRTAVLAGATAARSSESNAGSSEAAQTSTPTALPVRKAKRRRAPGPTPIPAVQTAKPGGKLNGAHA